MASEEFSRKAEGILQMIQFQLQAPEGYRPLRVTNADLDFMMARIREILEQVQGGNLPPRWQRRLIMTRIIADQWPLGSRLGNEISELEALYVKL